MEGGAGMAKTVNPLDYMPAWMAEHPYFDMEVIP
jgi:hypothetical protein